MTKKQILRQQFAYLRKLKRMKFLPLRSLHDNTMRDTKWDVKLSNPPRDLLEKRLFYYFCMNNYHLPKNNMAAKLFFGKAKEILSKGYHPMPNKTDEESLKRQLLFSKENIQEMPINQIDRYLAASGIYADVSETLRRTMLWEFNYSPAGHLSRNLTESGKVTRKRPRSRVQNKYVLYDLILANPDMSYKDFRERFGNQMPTVSSGSYKVARAKLKKAGYTIPDLRKGPSRAVIIQGKKTTRGKKLMDENS